MASKPATRAKKSKGLSPKTFRGMSKKKIQSGTSKNAGKRLVLDKGKTVPIQFLEKPEDMTEFEVHVFQENGRWEFIPCAGDNCPLCDDEDEERSRTSYRFATNVFNLKEKKVQILEGGKDLAGRIFYRYERKPASFIKRTFEVTRFDTKPVTFDVAPGEDDPVATRSLKPHDIDNYILEEMKKYYGDDLEAAVSELEDDDIDEDDDLEDEIDDEDEDEDDDDLDEDEDLDEDDEDDEDEEDEDDDEDDDDLDDEEDEDDDDLDEDEDDDLDDDDDDLDDDEDDDPPPARKPAKKAPAKKAPAKKAAPKKAPAKKAAPKRR